jgi:hypothetical protein
MSNNLKCDKCGDKVISDKGRHDYKPHIEIKVDGTAITICSIDCLIDWSIELEEMIEQEREMEEQAKQPEKPLYSLDIETTPNPGFPLESARIQNIPIQENSAFDPNQWVFVGRDNVARWGNDDGALPSPGRQNTARPFTTQEIEIGALGGVGAAESNAALGTWGGIVRSTEPAFRQRVFDMNRNEFVLPEGFFLTNEGNSDIVTNTPPTQNDTISQLLGN